MNSSAFGGEAGEAPTQFSHLYAVFHKNWSNNRLAPHFEVCFPIDLGNLESAADKLIRFECYNEEYVCLKIL